MQCSSAYIYFLHTFTRLVFSLLRATDVNMATITVNFERLFAAQLQLKAVEATQWTSRKLFLEKAEDKMTYHDFLYCGKYIFVFMCVGVTVPQ